MTEKTDGYPEPLRVQLIPRADAALDAAAGLTGHSKTDIINRALQMYAFVEDVLAKGQKVFIADADGGNSSQVDFQ